MTDPAQCSHAGHTVVYEDVTGIDHDGTEQVIMTIVHHTCSACGHTWDTTHFAGF